MQSLFNIKQEYQELIDELIENEGELTPELELALAITEENLLVKAENYATAIEYLKATTDMAANEMKRIAAIKKQSENATKRLKDAIAGAMELFQKEKLEAGLHKFSFRASKSVVIDDIEKLSGKFIAIEKVAIKDAIKDAINNGEEVTGAHIEQKKSLQIK